MISGKTRTNSLSKSPKSLKQPIREHLAELEDCLEKRLIEVNAHIASGENEHFEIKRRGSQNRWTLKYPRNTEPVNAPFFDALKQVDISSVLHFVQQHCPSMDAFDHVLGVIPTGDRSAHPDCLYWLGEPIWAGQDG